MAGTVVDGGSGLPIQGAQVAAVGTGQGAVTGGDGRFRVTRLPGTTVTLEVTTLGYRTATLDASVGDESVRIQLEETAVSLDGLVVTGTPAGERRRSLGNALASVDAAEVVAQAPVSNLSDLLRGRAAGVLVHTGSGMVGGGSQIRLRGVSSLSLFQEQPILYIDGVRVDNAIGTAGPQNQFPGQASNGGVMSRLDDLDPDEIERIEVIKGPAAATLFGTEASNGVIQVFTKKGSFGQRPELTLTFRQGANWFRNADGRWPTFFFENPESGEVETLNLIENEQRLGNDVFRTGHVQGYSASVRGGTEDLRYFLSLDYDSEEGFEPTNAREQFAGRVNLEFAAHPTVDVGANLGVSSGETELAGEVFRGIWPTLWGAEPTNEATRGWAGAPPEVWYDLEEHVGELQRYTAGLNLRHRPLEIFSHRLNVGLDVVNEDNRTLTGGLDFRPESQDFRLGFGTPRQGRKLANRREVVTTTVDYASSLELDLAEPWGSTTSVGFQLFREEVEFTRAEGQDFPAPGLETLGSTGRTFADDGSVESTTVGVFLQQRIGWNDRLFLTGAVRGDDNSAFGADFDLVVYPKVSASWVVSEEAFWGASFVDDLKLRAAYGESGQQPSAFAALRTFRPVSRADGSPAVTPESLGNPDLKPERGQEVEAGFEAGLFGDRLGLDFTFYHQTVEDAILDTQPPPSQGFVEERFENVGKIRNSGVELLVSALPVETRSLDWEVTVNFALNDSEVVDVGGDREFIPSSFRGRHQEGFAPFAWFDQRIVSAELDADGRAINVLCDGGRGKGGVEPGGEPVPCDEAPEIFLGRAIPKYQGSVSTAFTLFERLRIHGLVDFNAGFRQYNNTLGLRCTFGQLCEENHFPERFDPTRIANIQAGCCFDFDIEDAGWAKLREVSVSYDLPTAWAGRLGASSARLSVAGRNLAIWSGWSGLDPEGFQIGRPDRIGRQGLNAPQPTQFLTTLRLSF